MTAKAHPGPRRRGLWLGLALVVALLIVGVRLALHSEDTERPAERARSAAPLAASTLELPPRSEAPVLPLAAQAAETQAALPPKLGASSGERRAVSVRVTNGWGQAVEGAQVSAWTEPSEDSALLPPPGSRDAFIARCSAHDRAEWAEATWRQLSWFDPTWSASTVTAVTDESGRALLSLPIGLVAIEASKPGPGAGTSLCWTGDSGTSVTLELLPARRVSGLVLAASGAPVAGATVYSWAYWGSHSALRARRPLPQRTDAQGRFAFDVSESAYLQCWALADGDWTAGGKSGDSNLELTCELRFVGRFALEGLALRPGGEPAAGVQVWADTSGESGYESGSAVTADDGRFRIDVARPGPWTLIARSPDLISPVAHAVTLDDSSPVVDVLLPLVATASVTGRVSWDDGEPAPGFVVQSFPHRTKSGESAKALDFISGSPQVSCDVSGRFVASGLHPSLIYKLTASRAEDAAEVSVKAPSGATDVELVVERTRAGMAALSGQVVDARSGEPIRVFELRFNTIEYLGFNSNARTVLVEAADGRFIVDDRPRRNHWIELRAEGYATTTHGPFSPGEPFEVRLQDIPSYLTTLIEYGQH